MANNPILFIRSKKKNECDCFKQYLFLNKMNWYPFNKKYLLVDDNKLDFSEIHPVTKQLIIFGYKDIDYPLVETKNNNISHSWFKNKVTVGVFFIPKSSELFEFKGWQEQFENYVTFKNRYEFLMDDLPIIKNISAKLYKKIFNLISKKTSAAEIKDTILAVYEYFILELIKISEKRTENQEDIIATINKIRCNYYNLA